ncbi:MAG: 4-(cytidine 5'-diphospho)-2-C-methyl-D-erythritol kinase [Ferruginibacter sp.]
MLSFPNCKINIGLNILDKRADGFHNLQTIFYPIKIKDAVEVITALQNNTPIAFSSSGIPVDGEEKNNLCIKAYQLLQKDFSQLPAVQIHLHKNIPMGAGLGGGSADAAFTLQLLNQKYALRLTTDDLLKYSAALGSDVPFFILNSGCYATGRGEILEKVDLDLSTYAILVIHPGIHVNTGWAFSQIDLQKEKTVDLKAAVQKPVTEWRESITNNFETAVFAKYPEMADIKNTLYENGSLYAAMSGSGSSVYGIFEKETAEKINFPEHYFYKWV